MYYVMSSNDPLLYGRLKYAALTPYHALELALDTAARYPDEMICIVRISDSKNVFERCPKGVQA